MGRQAEEKKLTVGGVSTDYIEFGNGNIPLVLVPGLSLRRVKGTGLAIARMYRIFADQYKVYLFDRRDDIPEGFTIQDMAEDLADAMGELGIRSACVLGISQGGMIAQYLALEHPELVSRLCLGVTAARPNDVVRTRVETWIEYISKGDMKSMLNDMLIRMYSDAFIRKYGKLFPALLKFVTLTDSDRFCRAARAILTCNSYDRLEQIRCPVFVIGAMRDQVVSPGASFELAERLACPLYMYEEYGHAAYEEAPDFNKRVLGFFERKPGFDV